MLVRIVCDFKDLNKYTQFDPFPVAEQDEVNNKLAVFFRIVVFLTLKLDIGKLGLLFAENRQSDQWSFDQVQADMNHHESLL